MGKYANGDVTRTLRLFNLLHPRNVAAGMEGAYNRKREVMPVLLANEQEGVRVDEAALARDIALYRKEMTRVDAWLCKRLGNKELNIDADADLADALEASGVVTDFVLTKTRQKSVSKDNLTPDMFTDQRVARALGYRNRLATCLGTFMESWLATSKTTGGLLHTSWNQVRQLGKGKSIGARTGRLSSSPNFQNIPKNFDDKNDGYKHPSHIKDLLPLPTLRSYILPDKKQVICHRDYNQQEIRIMAHFEDGVTLAAYQEDPRLDFHNFVRDEIQRVIGVKLERRAVKILNFGMIYGMGLEALSNDLGCSKEEARKIKDAQRKALPGLSELEKATKERGKTNSYVRTWGGRVYHVEPPKTVDGRLWTFEYKLLNYLIQGSAADCTKQALINYANAPHEGRFMITVHDEINLSVPKGAVKREMALLRECMADVSFDLPMLSDGKTGSDWGSLTAYEEKK